MNQNYALIIGVQDYTTYDPSGHANVPGAQNDARAWVRSCLSIGFSPENIRVLVSPRLSASDLGPGTAGVQIGAADHDSIVNGLTWLSEQIGGDVPATGLITFSGHGYEGDDGYPVLCPSDLTPSLDNAIDVAAVRASAQCKVTDNLTAMIDSCSAQVGTSLSESIRGQLRAKRISGTASDDQGRARVVAASMQDQASVSSWFSGEQMGAFTWAATSTLGQWSQVVEDGVAYLDVSYGNLVTRVRSLLETLSFEQVPVVSGPQGTGGDAFLRPGEMAGRGEKSLQPTTPQPGRQLDMGNYEMRSGDDDSLIAYIVVDKNNETWWIYSAGVRQLSSNTSITLTRISTDPTGSPKVASWTSQKTTPTTANWTGSGSATYANAYNYRWSDGGERLFAMSFNLDSTTAPTDISSIYFYKTTTVGESFSPKEDQVNTFTWQGGAGTSTGCSQSYDAILTRTTG